MSKDAYYFSHDSNARNDLKHKALRCVYGWEGYGWYWVFVELMRDQGDYKLPYNGKFIIKIYSDELGITPEQAKQFIDSCINEFHLFESNGEYFWSNSLLRRMQHKENVSEKARKAAQIRWDANAMQTQCGGNALKKKKVKKIKEKKEKGKEYAKGVFLSEKDYQDLCERFGKKRIDGFIEKISDHQLSKGMKYEDHPATIKNWMRREFKVDSVKELEIPKIPKCQQCGNILDNEIKNGVHHCYSCGAEFEADHG